MWIPPSPTLGDVVYGDAISNARFPAPQTLTLLNRLTINLRSPMNVTDLSRHVDAAHATVRERLTDLTESLLLWPCHREQGLMPKLNAQTKWYFTDPLPARLASLRGYGQEPDPSRLTERQLGLTLARRLGDATTTAAVGGYDAVLYYRSGTGAEIDFVGRGLVPCAYESKYVDDERFGRMEQTFEATSWTVVVTTITRGVDGGSCAALKSAGRLR